MSPGSPMLEVRDLRVERGGHPVLDVASFALDDGEFVSLIGPNGCGKSTLLLTMMGLLPRAGGEVRFRGEDVLSGDRVARRRRMAMVLQEPLLFDATVQENVAAGLRMRGLSREETRRRVACYLERFRLSGLAQRSARKLSGGEARRVSLARALAVEPEVVLLDEPFASLDVPTRQAIVADLEKTIRASRMAAVLVTHDRSEALRLSDRIVVMNAGRIVQCDAPSVVMNSPVNEFVASCVGMETILPGEVVRSDNWEVAIAVGGQQIDALGEATVGEQVYCCVRPENVLIELVNPTLTSSARNVYMARITRVASVGPYLEVRLDCGFPLVAHVTPESFALLRLEEGKRVWASFKATAIHVIRKRQTAAAARPAPANESVAEGVVRRGHHERTTKTER
jgi:tungstate transport system ATP-binding protein